jgi:voltage-dependent potassium channel beta subunit
MEYRYLGSSGLQVSALSLGAWVTFGDQLDTEGAAECMRKAYDAGINFFDNAEAYAGGQAEVVMGKAIVKLGLKRSDLVISTKFFWGGTGPNDRGLSRKHIMEGMDASLERFRMEYVDLVFCHRPDPHTPIEETVWAMHNLIAQGRAFYWGTSEWSADQIMEAVGVARREHLIAPQMEQPQYNMFHRERVEKEYARLYGEIGLGTTTWSPLASGLLTGKYDRGFPADSRLGRDGYEWLKESVLGDHPKDRLAKVRALAGVAGDVGCNLAQLAIAWCLKNRHVSTVITGASRPEQVMENMRAIEVAGRMDNAVMEKIDEILQNKPAPIDDFR